MSIRRVMEDVTMYSDVFKAASIGASYKGSSTKKGNNPKAIKARRKKNKNKKTHRK